MSYEIKYVKYGTFVRFAVRPDLEHYPEVVYYYENDIRPPEEIVRLKGGEIRSLPIHHRDGRDFDHEWLEEELTKIPQWTEETWIKNSAKEAHLMAIHQHSIRFPKISDEIDITNY